MAGAVAAMGLIAGPAAAQLAPDDAQVIGRQLRAYEQAHTGQGLQRVFGPRMGQAREGATQAFTIPLQSRRVYALVGACDRDCTDLDFRLFDPNGQEVGSDLAADDAPMVRLRAGPAGRYRLEVIMVTCATNPCAFALNVYGR
jgi:hypothetical protein